jgi:SAM-dependent methyltransferase
MARETAAVEGYRSTSYGDGFADVYDEWYGDLNDADAVADLLAELAEAGRVLELGIGTGRLARPLAARGVAVFGLDVSAAMLSRLARHGSSDPHVLVARADMIAPPFRAAAFRLCFVAYNTLFNLPSRALQQRCFEAVADGLAPGGALVVEAFVPPIDGRSQQGVSVRDITMDGVVLTASRLDHLEQTITGQHIEIGESGIRLRPWFLHYLHPVELDEIAAEAGLRLERRWAGWRGEPFDDDSDVHVSVYRSTRQPEGSVK